MTLNEWILVLGIILLMFFVSEFLRKKLNPKTRLILSVIGFIVLMTIFIFNLANHFSKLQLVIIVAFTIAWSVEFYLRYKKYQLKTNK